MLNHKQPANLPDFAQQIDAAHARVASLSARSVAGVAPDPAVAEELLQELHTALEELRVSEEELRAQNDQLLDSHMALDALRRRYLELFELAPDGYLVTNELGVIRDANHAAGQLLGIPPGLLVGKPLAASVAPDERRMFRRRLTNALKEGGVTRWETQVRPRGGTAFAASVTLATPSPAREKIANQPAELRWLVRDISERKRAEAQRELLARAQAARAEAEASRARVSVLLDSMGAGFYTLDKASRFTYVNRHAERLLNRPRETLLGRNIWAEFPATVGTQSYQEICRALREQTPVSFETRSVQVGTWVEVHAYPAPAPDSLAVSFRDIALRKEGEQALQAAYQRERRIAEALQRSLLRSVPADAFPGLAVATFYEAALAEAQVGGDFFDVFSFDSGKVALVVGDVSGKGLTAAACTAEVKYALRAFLRSDIAPASALAHLNDFLCDARRQSDWDSDMFVVLALAVIDPDTGEAEFCLAGSEPLLLLRAGGGVEVVDAKGMLLGIQPGMPYVQATRQMEPGDAVLIATDGITEARRGDDFLGFDGLREIAHRLASEQEAAGQADVDALGRAILQGAHAFAGGPLHDDACLLIAQRRACP